MKKWLKRSGLILLGLILILAVIAGFYISDYYHAASTLAEYQQDSNLLITADRNLITITADDNTNKGIIFYPGGKVEFTAYIPLLSKIAELGYVCYLPKMPANLAVFGINKAQDIIDANPQIETWYIGGHSLGGAMAAQFAGEHSDELAGLILMGAYPATNLRNTDLALISIVGSADQIMNQSKYEDNQKLAPTAAIYEVIEGGNHSNFGDYGDQKGDGQATISRLQQYEAVKKILTQLPL